MGLQLLESGSYFSPLSRTVLCSSVPPITNRKPSKREETKLLLACAFAESAVCAILPHENSLKPYCSWEMNHTAKRYVLCITSGVVDVFSCPSPSTDRQQPPRGPRGRGSLAAARSRPVCWCRRVGTCSASQRSASCFCTGWHHQTRQDVSRVCDLSNLSTNFTSSSDCDHYTLKHYHQCLCYWGQKLSWTLLIHKCKKGQFRNIYHLMSLNDIFFMPKKFCKSTTTHLLLSWIVDYYSNIKDDDNSYAGDE